MEKIKLKIWSNMEKNTLGFSLIEILVVVLLITIVSTTWMYYFQDFLQKQESNIHIQSLDQKIELLDKKVKSKTIYDYSLTLENNYIKVSENTYGLDNIVTFQRNSENSWYFSLSPIEENNIFQYIILKNWKKIEENNIPWDGNISVNISDWDIQISWKLWNTILNNSGFSYLDENKFLKIYDIVDNNNESTQSLIIQNISWLKKYKNWQNGNTLDTPIEIFFEYKWFQNTLILE